jgi:methyl-accepting chemotaxis protein
MTFSAKLETLFAGRGEPSHDGGVAERHGTEGLDDDVERIFDGMAAELPDRTPMEPIAAARERVKRLVAREQREVSGDERATAERVADDGVATNNSAPAPAGDGQLPVAMEYALDRVRTPIFTLDAEGNVVHWNNRIEALSGVDAVDAWSMEMASQAFYPDGRRTQTLAEKVLEHPGNADGEFATGRAGDTAFRMYADESTMVDRNGVERYLSFSAAPLYDDAGDLVGVIEMVNDRTEDIRRMQEIGEPVTELQETIDALPTGNHGARAAFEGMGYLDESLLGVMDGLNALAGRPEALPTHVFGRVEELEDSSGDIAETAKEINGLATDHSETIGTTSGEVADLSVTVEEVASTADEVQERGSRADTLAVEERDSAAKALEAMESVDDVATQVGNIAEETDQQQRRVQDIRMAPEETTV